MSTPAAGKASGTPASNLMAARLAFERISGARKRAVLRACALIAAASYATSALGDDKADKDNTAKNQWPNIYFDISSGYSATPAGAVLVGPRALPFATSASKSFATSVPLTVDLNDRVSVYAGLDGSTSRTNATSWSRFEIGNWSAGFSADIVKHDGLIPTVTLSGGVSRPVKPPSFGALTTWTGGLDIDFPFNEDETRGVVAGVSLTRSFLDNGVGTIRPTLATYGGAYYQWDSGWKLTGRAGVQVFRGANIGSILQVKRATLPFTAVDFELFDDNDNRLFGLSLALGWSPKPAAQLTLSTPLYFVRH